MLYGYNHSVIKIKDGKADSLAVKSENTAVQIYTFVNGECQINTDNFPVGEYYLQFFKEQQIIKTDVLQIEQNLKYAGNNYNPKSRNKIILEAITACLQGRATHGQDYVKVGEKQLHYMSYDQLMKLKDYYEVLVRKQDGKAPAIRFEKLYRKMW